MALHFVIMDAIVEIGLQPLTHGKLAPLGHSHIAQIKQSMDAVEAKRQIARHQQTKAALDDIASGLSAARPPLADIKQGLCGAQV